MAQISHADTTALLNLGSQVAADNGAALLSHALAFGAGESSVEAQHVKAIQRLTALQAAGLPNAANISAAVTDALAVLNARLAYLRNPAGGVKTEHA